MWVRFPLPPPTIDNTKMFLYTCSMRDYMKRQLVLTELQTGRVYDLFEQHRVPAKLPDLAPYTEFSIRYQFSTIGVAKMLDIGDKSFIINDEELENL